jgi:hypothetical protein
MVSMELCTSPIRELDPLIAETLALRVALCLWCGEGFKHVNLRVSLCRGRTIVAW